jgi:FdhE protein
LWEAALQALDDPVWQDTVPQPRLEPSATAPLLAGVTIAVDAPRMSRWVCHLVALAARHVTPDLAQTHLDQDSALALLEAVLCQDQARVSILAQAAGVAPQALLTIGQLAILPLLQTYGRHLAPHVSPTWSQGYCPICGAWPALAEVRGLEHARALRCARCGADWRTTWLKCSFCGETDHRRLRVLMPEHHGETRKIDACLTCQGYLKTVTTLQALPAAVIPLEDLATVDLDVIALEHHYARPEQPAYAMASRVIAQPARSRYRFGWRR